MFWNPTSQTHTSTAVREMPVPTTGASVDVSELETAFRRWVTGRARPEQLSLDGGAAVSLPMEDALRRLRVSSSPLSPAPAGRLGLPDGATVGTAAEALLHARLDPRGPRCRSFRSAALYLVGLADLQLDGPDPVLQRSTVDVA